MTMGQSSAVNSWKMTNTACDQEKQNTQLVDIESIQQ